MRKVADNADNALMNTDQTNHKKSAGLQQIADQRHLRSVFLTRLTLSFSMSIALPINP